MCVNGGWRMQLNVDLTVISLVAGIVSLAVGVLAMVLSVLFYIKSNDLILETTKTLGEIKQTTTSLEKSVTTIITRTIDYLTGSNAPADENLKKAATAADELLERFRTELGDTELGQKVQELESAFRNMRSDYAAAVQDLERRRALTVPPLAELDEDVAVTDKASYADLWVARGWMLYLAGDLDASIEASRRALDLVPTEPHARPNLAIALLTNGRKSEALEEYERFLEQSPDANYIWLAIKDLEDARRSEIDGLDDMVKLLVAAAEAAESREQEDSVDEIPF